MTLIHYPAKSISKLTKDIIKEEYDKLYTEEYIADQMCNIYSDILREVDRGNTELCIEDNKLPYPFRKLLRQQGYMILPQHNEYNTIIGYWIIWSFLRHFRYFIINRKDK